eukprot:4716273-Pyramimonas_sp.AAC.1
MIEDAKEAGEWARAKAPQVLGQMNKNIAALSVALRDNKLAHFIVTGVCSPQKAARVETV